MSEADVTTSPSPEAADDSPSVRRRVLTRPALAVGLLAVLVFLLGGAGGSYQGKLGSVAKNDNQSFLPPSAESTHVTNESGKFLKIENIPGFVLFHRQSGLTAADKAYVDKAFAAVRAVPGVDVQAMSPIEYSADGTTAAIYAPLVAKANGKSVNGEDLSANEKKILAAARVSPPSGLQVVPAGVGGLLVAFVDAFKGIDGALLFAAIGIVIVILLGVYRSPVVWIFPLFSALLSLGLASMVIYFLAKNGTITLTGQSQSILSVLVLGAGTDYALLLTSRYREELHAYDNRFEAMMKAWHESAPAIVASAFTVMAGLLCLNFSELNSNKSLAPVGAIGVGCTFIVMMTFFPVALAAAGRWVFWPRKPKVDHAVDLATHGLWGAIATWVGKHHRMTWIGATVVLGILLTGLTQMKTSGLTITDSFTTKPEAVVGEKLYEAKFDKGAGAPVVIVTDASAVSEVIATVAKDPGILAKPGAVCVQVDYAKIAAAGPSLRPGPDGCPPESVAVAPIDGRTIVNATLADSYDSSASLKTVKRLRAQLHAMPNAHVIVGGSTAQNLDVRDSSVRDRQLIIPIVLTVIVIVLALLLRALVAPLILVATVVLSFLATLGVCGFVFYHVFNFKNADQAFPLFAFVFLVALGIDYNIFLMTRVREETIQHGTREGVLRGLAVTGGVITSAGAVLAATFAVLGVLPIVFIAELGFAVAFGVLLDTLVVRSLLVPALAHDIGKKIWWPSTLASAQD